MDGAEGIAERGNEGAWLRYGVGGDISARKTGSGRGVDEGDGEREPGRGIWDGVDGLGSRSEVTNLLLGGCLEAIFVSDFGFVREEGLGFVGVST